MFVLFIFEFKIDLINLGLQLFCFHFEYFRNFFGEKDAS